MRGFRLLWLALVCAVAIVLQAFVPVVLAADISHMGTQQKVLVICVKYKDIKDTRLTANQWVNLLNNETNDFYNKATFNQTNFSFETPQGQDVPADGWFDLGYKTDDFKDKPNSKFKTIGQAAIDLADPFVDFSQYHRVLVITNSPKFGGKGTQGFWWWRTDEGIEAEFEEDGKTVGKRLMSLALVNEWEAHSYGNPFDEAGSVVAHELGHNLGVRTHYKSLKWHPGTALDAITPWDIMGKSPTLNHFLGWAKTDRGWIPPACVQTVGPPVGADIDTIITLRPQEVSTDGVQVIKIPFTETAPGAPFIGYVLENRRKINGDERLPSEGVLISLVNESPDAVLKCFVVPDPGTPDTLKEAPLELGDSFHDPTHNITVTVLSQSGDDYNVRIQYKLPPNAKPDPMIIPWGAPPWETVDIWVDSEKNGWDTYKYTDPDGNPVGNGDDAWVDRINRVYVRVRNIGPGVAANVKVGVYVTQPPGMGDVGADWKHIGTIVFPSIGPGQVVEDYVKWKPTVGTHTCIKAVIENIPGELSTENNTAQENVAHFTTSASSPYKPVSLKMVVNNPFPNEESYVHYHVRDIPSGWTVSVEPPDSTLPPGGHDHVRLTIYPPEKDRPGLVGKPKIEALVPYADTYLPIGGVEAWVHLTKPTALDLKLASEKVVQPGQRVVLEGRLTPSIPNATVAVEFTVPKAGWVEESNPQPSPGPTKQREIQFVETDKIGNFKVAFVPPAAGRWIAQAFYSGNAVQAPAESEPCQFEVLAGSAPALGRQEEASRPGATGDVVRFVIGQRGYRVENRFIDTDVAPFIFQGRTFVPVRFLADSLGATTRWDGATRTVTITQRNTEINLRVGDKNIVINGIPRSMDVSPMIKNNRVYLPARWVAEALGARVSWDSSARAVIAEPARGGEEAPTKPTNLVASPADSRGIKLSWDCSTDDKAVVGYAIYRSEYYEGRFSRIGSSEGTTYIDSNVEPGTMYYYYVRAYDTDGHLSLPSNIVRAMIQRVEDSREEEIRR